MKRLPAVMLLCLAPASLTADPASECNASSQVEIGSCIAETLARVDGVIETYLGFARSSATELDDITGRPVSAPALDASQTAWSAYRDAHCDFIGTTFGGGSGTGIAIDSCRIELGRARAEELLRAVQ